MKETGYTPPYECEAFKRSEDVINAEEVGICITDISTSTVLFVNNKMAAYADEADITGMMGKRCPASKYTDKKGPCPFCSNANLLDWDGKPLEPHIREEYVEGMDIWLRIVDQAVEWAKGRLIRIVTFYDITKTHKINEQITDFKFRDRLLGLKNGASLEQDMQEAAVKPSLLLFEILSIQKTNEFYGRKTGDYLLSVIRDTILSQNISGSELYRIGGDKFCLTIGNISRGELKRLAEYMSGLFPGTWEFEYEDVNVKSFNDVVIAIIPGAYIQKKKAFLSMSERMLAKAREKKKIVVYNKKMEDAHRDRLKMEWDLKRCVHEDMRGFDIFYQPIVHSGSKTWCGLEALCRWNSPELGVISPEVFIPEAERLELIEALGLWVLETAVSRCKAWKLDKCGNFILNVNLSAVQFQSETMANEIIEILKKYDFPGEKLCIEITESTSITFLGQSLRAIEQLRDYNMLVALDDFGTGYSSFSRLKNMPVDIVKIEKMFVSNIENDEYHRYLFQTMTDLAHAANLKLIAEGVERKRQMNILVKKGADFLQGYLFSKPLPPRDLENELTNFYSQEQTAAQGGYFTPNANIEDDAI